MKSTTFAGSATLIAAGAFASPAMAATVDFTATNVGSGTAINLIGDSTPEYYFQSSTTGGVTLRGKEFSGNTVGVVSATPYYPTSTTTGQMKSQTITTDGYYGLIFSSAANAVDPTTVPATQYTGYALVDRGGTHISEVDFRVLSAVPEPASWALMVLGFGATGAALRQRRRQASAAVA